MIDYHVAEITNTVDMENERVQAAWAANKRTMDNWRSTIHILEETIKDYESRIRNQFYQFVFMIILFFIAGLSIGFFVR